MKHQEADLHHLQQPQSETITIEANNKRVDYLDITLDLITGSYKPFNKPGNEIQYVNRRSNHPPAVLRTIPDAINKRLSKISSDEQAFNSAAKTTVVVRER